MVFIFTCFLLLISLFIVISFVEYFHHCLSLLPRMQLMLVLIVFIYFLTVNPTQVLNIFITSNKHIDFPIDFNIQLLKSKFQLILLIFKGQFYNLIIFIIEQIHTQMQQQSPIIQNPNKAQSPSIQYTHYQNQQNNFKQQNIQQPIQSPHNHNHNNNQLKQNKPSIKIRNRRYKKLLQLRNNGFFTQQAIKLRHPLLYFLYIRQYDFSGISGNNQQSYPHLNNKSLQNEQANNNNNENQPFLLSDFLQKNLLNTEYKNLLGSQMSQQVLSYLQMQKNLNQSQIEQIKRMFNKEKLIKKDKQMKDSQEGISNMKENKMNINEFIEQREQRQQTQMQLEQSSDKTQKTLKREQLCKQLINHQPSQREIQSLRQFYGNDLRLNAQVKSYNHQQRQPNSTYQQINKKKSVNNNNSTQELLLTNDTASNIYQKVTQHSYKLSLEQQQLQQQNLIQHCEQLFLQGKLINITQINYNQIDLNDQYDDYYKQNQDLEERYFNQVENIMEQGNQYTGIQDY